MGLLKPMGVMFVLAVLLLLQPDLGTVVVLLSPHWRCCSWRVRRGGS
ncbi:hypothetical protein ACNKHW_00590 [Shigella flexneri]